MGTKSTAPSHSVGGVAGEGAPLGGGVGALEGTELAGAIDGAGEGRLAVTLGGKATGASVTGPALSVGRTVGVDDGVALSPITAHPEHVLAQRAWSAPIRHPPCSWNSRQSGAGMESDTSSHEGSDTSGANVVVAGGMSVGRPVGSPVGSPVGRTDGSIVGSAWGGKVASCDGGAVLTVGAKDGTRDGAFEGVSDGLRVAGLSVGELETGKVVGPGVGLDVGSGTAHLASCDSVNPGWHSQENEPRSLIQSPLW